MSKDYRSGRSPFGIDRRLQPRYETRVLARIFDAVADAGEPGVRPLLPMVGHTRDISETGLAIVVTSDAPGNQRDELVGRELRIVLDLPAGPTNLRCTVVRVQQTVAEADDEGYLIGVRITQMNDKDWVDMVRLTLQERT